MYKCQYAPLMTPNTAYVVNVDKHNSTNNDNNDNGKSNSDNGSSDANDSKIQSTIG